MIEKKFICQLTSDLAFHSPFSSIEMVISYNMAVSVVNGFNIKRSVRFFSKRGGILTVFEFCYFFVIVACIFV